MFCMYHRAAALAKAEVERIELERIEQERLFAAEEAAREAEAAEWVWNESPVFYNSI